MREERVIIWRMTERVLGIVLFVASRAIVMQRKTKGRRRPINAKGDNF